MRIEVRDLVKAFGGTPVLRGVSVEVPSGKLVALLGPSGCGKTTLLRVMAGLELADSGEIFLDGREVSTVPVKHRGLGFVFQHFALFGHMTVFENVAFGLRVQPRRRRLSREKVAGRVGHLLRLMRLAELTDHFPNELSGGQRQRVALARALAVEPKILLLDEPFGALDAQVRRELRTWLRRLHDELGLTSLFVTHDQEEALELADHVAVMRAGQILQVGTPQDVYDRPASPFVHNFLGKSNRLHGEMRDGCILLGGMPWFSVDGELGFEGPVLVCVRPHHLRIVAPGGERESIAGPWIDAHVRHVAATGPLIRVDLMTAWGESLWVEIPRDRSATALARGAEVRVVANQRDLVICPAGEETRS